MSRGGGTVDGLEGRALPVPSIPGTIGKGGGRAHLS